MSALRVYMTCCRGLPVLVAACAFIGTVYANSLGIMGPYIIYADKMYQCEPGASNGKLFADGNVTKFDVKKPHNLQRFTSFFNVTQPITDKYWARGRLDAHSNGQWKQNALVFGFRNKGCSNFRTHLWMLFQSWFHTEIQERKECHVPVGVYSCVNQPINWTFPKFPVLPYGFYRFTLLLGLGDETYLCHYTEGHSIPRRL